MKKTVVLSTNENDDYLFYLPIVANGWIKLGYDVFLFYLGDEKNPKFMYAKSTITRLLGDSNQVVSYYTLKPIEGIQNNTLVQCSRLFASHFFEDTRIVTSDIDMLVVQDIFKNEHDIEVYGHDLTNRQHFPICYVNMTAEKWNEVMDIDYATTIEEKIEKVIKEEPFHNSTQPHEVWVTDQEILMKKLRDKWYISFDRGVDAITNLPKGRLDRYGWMQPRDPIIDVHLPRNPLSNLDKILPLIDNKILVEYCNGYKEQI